MVSQGARGQDNFGYNAQTGEYGDMVSMGVLDPTNVTGYALQNAVSVAALILTTDAIVAEMPKDAGDGWGEGQFSPRLQRRACFSGAFL